MSFFNVLVGKDKLGRVTAAQQLLNFGLLSMLTLIAGWAMQHWGYQAVTVSLAALMLLGMITALFTGALRTMPTPARWGEHISMRRTHTVKRRQGTMPRHSASPWTSDARCPVITRMSSTPAARKEDTHHSSNVRPSRCMSGLNPFMREEKSAAKIDRKSHV